MFKESFRKKLIEQGWLEAVKEGGNEHQSWRRVKNNTKTAISDLVLLYEKLPQEKRDEIFNLQNFEELFNQLLTPMESSNQTRLELANYLIKKLIILFKREHTLQNRNTIVLGNVINEYLDKALEICKDIFYLRKMNKVPKEISKEGIRYLCSWSELIDREKNNLEQFISDKHGLFPFEINIEHNLSKKFEIKGNFEDQGREKYFLKLYLNESKSEANLLIQDKNDYKTIDQFIVKHLNNEYLLYYKT
ncbi:MAG: hypothetical protein L0H55_13205 [Candidatus Nitrosocosmicus sp.]|nr:hypothetical protein [Candidatus Nitrosocosmicus sp.]